MNRNVLATVMVFILLFWHSVLWANIRTMPISTLTLMSLSIEDHEEHGAYDHAEGGDDHHEEDEELEEEMHFSPEELEEIHRHMEEALGFMKKVDKWLYTRITDDGEPVERFEHHLAEFTYLWMESQEAGKHGEDGQEEDGGEERKLMILNLTHMIYETHLGLLMDDFYETEDHQKRGKVKEHLIDILDSLFDVKIKIRELEIIEIQKELEALKAQVKEAKVNKEHQIQIYLEKITDSGEMTVFEQ